MTFEERDTIAKYAMTLKPQGYNCAQSVIKALEDYMGEDTDAYIRATAGFGGGMGCMENSCGAMLGASMVASRGIQGRDAIMKSRIVLLKFKDCCGAILCKDLKGKDTGKALMSCPECIYNATMIALEELDA